MANNVKGKIIVNFTEATSRQSLETGEQLPTIIGKIKKFFTDLKTVAFTGSYTDLSNKPTIPTKVSQLTNDSGFTKTVVDSALSSTSTNPVQNKVINTALAGKAVIKRLKDESLDDIKTPGFYNAAGGNGCTNKPSGVNNFGLYVIHRASGAYYTQILISSDLTQYRRHCDDSVWTSWVEDKLSDTTYSNFVKSGTGAKAGLVPAPSTTAGTTKYLREDGTWQVPPNTNTKVTNTLATTTKAYVTGTTSATTNTGTQVFDTGVYLDTTAGQLTATTFKGALSGNASTATTATKVGTATVGSATQPVYINAGVPTKCTYTLGKSVPSNAVFTDTKYSVVSTTANGLMSSADKIKLDGIAEGASKASSTSYQTIQQMTEF